MSWLAIHLRVDAQRDALQGPQRVWIHVQLEQVHLARLQQGTALRTRARLCEPCVVQRWRPAANSGRRSWQQGRHSRAEYTGRPITLVRWLSAGRTWIRHRVHP